MRSSQWFDLQNRTSGIDLTATLSGTGAATAKLYPNGQIIIDAAAAEAAKTITLTTPYGFDIIDAHVINGAATAVTVTVKNNATAITDAMTPAAGADLVVARAGTIDDAQVAFAVDDDDLVIAVGNADLTGRVVLNVIFN